MCIWKSILKLKKILRNECEEEFRIVLQKVRNTILELLNVIVLIKEVLFKRKIPFKIYYGY